MAVKSLKRSTLESTYASDNSLNAGYSFQDFHHLETIQLGGPAASVSFLNVDKYSGKFKHLQIRAVARTNRTSSTADFLKVTFNSDTTGYSRHALYGNGSSVGSYGLTDLINTPDITGDSAGSGQFGFFIMDIADAFNSNKNTTIKSIGGNAGSFNQVLLGSGLWIDTSIINNIKFESGNGSFNIVSGSRFSLYGIR